MRRIILLLIVIWGLLTEASSQQVTIGNNLLYDAWLTPNLRIGTQLSSHWSMGLTAGFRPWPTNDETSRKWRHLLLSPDWRYWTDSVHVHHFFGANLIYSHYNVADVKFPFGMYKSVRDERRQGDLGALGLFYGYSWPLGRYWNIEALIGAAGGYTQFKRYTCGHCGMKIGTGKKLFMMPMAALNIVYTIPVRQRLTEEQSVIAEPVTEFVFVPFLTEVSMTSKPTRRLCQDERPTNVHFPVNKSDLRSDFRNNAEVLSQLIDLTQQMLTDSNITVKTIQIIGFASIEGPVARNEQLGRERALALQHYMQNQLHLPDSLFDTVGGGEAWDDFHRQLEEEVARESDYSEQMRQALTIIDGENNLNVREQKLRKMNGGRTWAYIKEHILSDQRNSGYMRAYYKYDPDKVAAVINRAIGLLRTDCSDCHHEALEQLTAVAYDERALNPLGVALYLCGRTDEAINCFRRAAENGNADARDNLRQLQHP